MKLNYDVTKWQVGDSEDGKPVYYESSPTLESGDYADIMLEISMEVMRSPIYLNDKGEKRSDVPDQERFPEKFEIWLQSAIGTYLQKYKNQAAFIAAKSLLYPCEGSPSLDEQWMKGTLEQRLKIGAFFLGSLVSNSAVALLSARNGNVSGAAAVAPLKITSPLSTKNTTGSRVRRERGSSRTTSKATKKRRSSR